MSARALRPWVARRPELGTLGALVLLALLNASLTPGFATSAMLWSILIQAVTTLIVGTGMTLVIAMGGIDLSVGSVMAVASAVTVTLLPHGITRSVLGALAVGLAIGAANGILIARYAILPIVVTLATLMIGRGAAQLVVAGNPLVAFTHPSFERLGKGYWGPVPIQVLLSVAILVVFSVFVRSTLFGRYLVAVGGNERAARLAGVRVAGVKVLVYALCSVLSAVAGLVETARLGATDAGTIGLQVELDAIVAVVIGGAPLSGGRARVMGTALGALLMSMLTATLAMHLVHYAWSLLVKALILGAAVWTQQRRRD